MSKKIKALVIYWLFLLLVATLPTTYAWFIINQSVDVTGLSGQVKEIDVNPTVVRKDVAYVDLTQDLIFDYSGTLNQMASAIIVERLEQPIISDLTFDDLLIEGIDKTINIQDGKFVYLIIPEFTVVKDNTGIIPVQPHFYVNNKLPSIEDDGNKTIQGYDFYLLLQQIYKHYFEGEIVYPYYESETQSLYNHYLNGKFGDISNWENWTNFEYEKYWDYYIRYSMNGLNNEFTMYRYALDGNGKPSQSSTGIWSEWTDHMPDPIVIGGTHLGAIQNYNSAVIDQIKENHLAGTNLRFAVVMWALYHDGIEKNPIPNTQIVDFKINIE